MGRRIAITGASGLLGSHLADALQADGHTVHPMVRDRDLAHGDAIHWSVRDRAVDVERLEGVDAVVHLAGEPIGARRWNEAAKRRIRDSRVEGTELLAEALAGLDRRPEVLVSASAIGVYGDRGDEVLTESSAPGRGFLPDVVQAWEAAAAPARRAGIRVVHPRTGIVLTASGGALARLLVPFRLFVGGHLGSGRQQMSWITLADEVRALRHLLDGDLDGPVNLTAPNPASNRALSRALGRVLGRPAVVPVPAAAIRLALGEMGEALVLHSQHVLPERLVASGFTFRHPELEPALRWALAN